MDSAEGLSLASGVAGHALFYAYLARHCENSGGKFRRISKRSLDRLVSELSDANLLPGLFTGLAGIAWASRKVTQVLNIRDLDGYSDVYEQIGDYLSCEPRSSEYDLIAGLSGIGAWILTIPEVKWRAQLLELVLQRLSQTSELDDGALRWPTPSWRPHPIETESPERPQYNLGLAHGIPGIIGFLTECLRQGVSQEETTRLICGALKWLERRALPHHVSSYFSYVSDTLLPARLAWCYGDAGVALVVNNAAHVLRRNDIHEFANRLTKKAADRRGDSAQIMDAGVCHGTAGLVLIFNHLARVQQIGYAAGAADYWLNLLLQSRRPELGICGFSSWDGASKAYKLDSGYLSGAPGVALVLLGIETGDFGWAYPLLLQDLDQVGR
ncbi:lanthionine synthetase C family protein [Sinimarinibacterium flocculans]|uniref:lanthionine synthetase C family protein n=1 Tax=Sinimarinibacterium flocculans TaxID=985250 RepID=UPI0035128583